MKEARVERQRQPALLQWLLSLAITKRADVTPYRLVLSSSYRQFGGRLRGVYCRGVRSSRHCPFDGCECSSCALRKLGQGRVVDAMIVRERRSWRFRYSCEGCILL